MKIKLLTIALGLATNMFAQSTVFKSGEWLKYRMHYGIINAGYATVEIDDIYYNSTPHFHVKGKGWTTGITNVVFPVYDDYQSYIHKTTLLPSKAIRKVSEGGYTKNEELYFKDNTVVTIDKKANKTFYNQASKVQDMISTFYYLRNHVPDSMQVNEYVDIPMFFDEEVYTFRLLKLGVETIKTDFGKVRCYKFRPMVKSGRVFKRNESLTMWVSADGNKIPIRIQADLRVGSLKADIDQYKGLSYPLNVIR